MAARAQGCELPLAGVDESTDRLHYPRSQPSTLEVRVRRDRLHVCGPERQAGDVQLALDYGRVTDDGAIQFEQEVRPAQGVLPIVLGEATVLIGGKRVVH
jgi:hypothetical protein